MAKKRIQKEVLRRSRGLKEIWDALDAIVLCPDCWTPLGELREIFTAPGTKLDRIKKSKAWVSCHCDKCRRQVILLTRKAYWREVHPEWKDAIHRWNFRPNRDAMNYRVPGSTRQ